MRKLPAVKSGKDGKLLARTFSAEELLDMPGLQAALALERNRETRPHALQSAPLRVTKL
jgi:hypothetical protein